MDSNILNSATTIFSTLVGGMLTLSGTYLVQYLKDKKENEEFLKTKKIYHKLLIQEFEKSLSILKKHDWTSNPYKAIDYSFFRKNRFKFSTYIPDEVYEYGEFLKKCQIEIHSFENGESLKIKKMKLKEIVYLASEKLEDLRQF